MNVDSFSLVGTWNITCKPDLDKTYMIHENQDQFPLVSKRKELIVYYATGRHSAFEAFILTYTFRCLLMADYGIRVGGVVALAMTITESWI